MTNIQPCLIVQEAKNQYQLDRIVGLFSGGKDSLTICHYLWTQGLLNEVLYCDTGIKVKDNFEYVKQTCDKYKWRLNIVHPLPHETYEIFVKRFGFPRNGIHSAIMGFLKWHPIRKWCRENKVLLVSGRRQKESKRRMRLSKYIEHPEKNIYICSPLFYWTTAQVWEYIKQNNLEICPVYKTLHMSGDCLCGSFSELGESQLIATFHPEVTKQITDLETRYKGKWGNQVSMGAAKKQSKLVDYICNECIYR